MVKTLVLFLVFSVGSVGAAEWERIEKLPDLVANSEVVIQYTDGSLRLLQQVGRKYYGEDGKLTVETFVDFLARWELDNGKLPKFLFWARQDNHYAVAWALPPEEEEPLYIQFTHLLSKRQGGGSKSRLTAIERGARVFGSDDDIGTAVRSVFIRGIQSHVSAKYKEDVVFPKKFAELLVTCGKAGDAARLLDSVLLNENDDALPRCGNYKAECLQDQTRECISWRAKCPLLECYYGRSHWCESCTSLWRCLSSYYQDMGDCKSGVTRYCNDFPTKCDEIAQEACKRYPDVCGRRAG